MIIRTAGLVILLPNQSPLRPMDIAACERGITGEHFDANKDFGLKMIWLRDLFEPEHGTPAGSPGE